MELLVLALAVVVIPLILIATGLIILGSVFSVLRKDQNNKTDIFLLEEDDF